MTTNNYSFSFTSSWEPEEIFKSVLDVKEWWSGIYEEQIVGTSNKLNDEFTFTAGGGVHNSTQRLTELVPNKKICWRVIDSNLTFLKKTDEWTNTTICFEISREGTQSKVTFTHQGLVPDIECYGECTSAWTKYLQNLAEKMK